MACRNIQLTHLTLRSPRVTKSERLLLLCDLHQQVAPDLVSQCRDARPTAILIAGDFLEVNARKSGRREALELLARLTQLCPVYYSLGNHELGCSGAKRPMGERSQRNVLPSPTSELMESVRQRGAFVLDDCFVEHGSLCLGGLTSAGGRPLYTSWLSEMEAHNGFRLLLCHHPEYYKPYLAHRSLDLTVSGHAHGGQWRLFGRGVYAPGQGLLARYTDGLYEKDRLLVSRGMSDRGIVPRICNPKQMLLITLEEQTT